MRCESGSVPPILSCQPLWEVETRMIGILLRRKPIQRGNKLAQGLIGNTWSITWVWFQRGEFLIIGWYCLSCHLHLSVLLASRSQTNISASSWKLSLITSVLGYQNGLSEYEQSPTCPQAARDLPAISPAWTLTPLWSCAPSLLHSLLQIVAQMPSQRASPDDL